MNKREFVMKRLRDFLRNAVGIAHLCALPGEALQFLLRRGAAPACFFRIFIAQFVERELRALRHMQGLFNGGRMIPEKTQHFTGRF